MKLNSSMKKGLAGVIFFMLMIFQLSASPFEGQVFDKISKQPLPFVTIIYSSSGLGTITNIDGRFTINNPVEFLRFSYVGYETLLVSPENFPDENDFYLNACDFKLQEVKVYPGENPSHRIIKKLVENRDQHNPDKLSSYQYHSYNKLEFTILDDKGLLTSLPEIPVTKNDSSLTKFKDFINKQHLFLIETASLKSKQNPEKEKETVLATKVSGLQDASFFMLATDLQSLSFYNDEVIMLEKRFASPAARKSWEKYLFQLTDILFTTEGDTVFTISFRPRKGKYFNGLVGVMNIHTNGYAIQSIRAEDADKENDIINIKVEQRSELLPENKWFTKELNSKILYNKFKIQTADDISFRLQGSGKTYLFNVKINPEFQKNELKGPALSIEENANKRDQKYWNLYRSTPLSPKDTLTYHVIDSLGWAEKLDLKMKALFGLADKKLPIGKVSLRLDEIVNYNHYEGLQLGLGIETNETFNKFIQFGGYWRYGDEKQEHKYGGNLNLNLRKLSETKIFADYRHDRREIGHLQFLEQAKAFSSEEYRELLYTDVFKFESFTAGFDHRWTPFLKTRLQYVRFNIFNPTVLNPVSIPVENYKMDKIGIKMRLSFKEKFFDNGKEIVSLGNKYPLLLLNYERSVGHLPSNEYYSFEFKIIDSFHIRKVGTSYVNIVGGVRNETGISNLFLSPPSANDNLVTIYTENAFATMPMNSFFANRMIALFWEHSFGSTLYKNRKFRPMVSLALNAGYGTTDEEYAAFPSFEKGYYEAGLIMKKLYRGKIFSYGVGIFYRLGAYHSNELTENLAIKFTLDLSI